MASPRKVKASKSNGKRQSLPRARRAVAKRAHVTSSAEPHTAKAGAMKGHKVKTLPPARPPVLSKHLLAGAAALAGAPEKDARVIELFLEWCSQRVLRDALDVQYCLLARRIPVREEGRCPGLRAAQRSEAALDEPERAVLRALVEAPAQGLHGLALKLLIWRWQSSHSTDGALEEIEEGVAFSAYRDVLRLANLQTLAHPRDAKTAAFLRAGGMFVNQDE